MFETIDKMVRHQNDAVHFSEINEQKILEEQTIDYSKKNFDYQIQEKLGSCFDCS